MEERLQWGEPSVQYVLDTALAWAVINNQFEIADLPDELADPHICLDYLQSRALL